jgi:hypothetical protein
VKEAARSKHRGKKSKAGFGKGTQLRARERPRRRTTTEVAKDGPFPHRKLSKDGPFPMWIRIAGGGPVAHDGPFPMANIGLDYERVPFTTLYQGSRGPAKPISAVVHSKSDLLSNWPEIAQTGISPDEVNFDSEEVVVVGLGQRPDNGYMVQVEDVLYFTDRGKGREPLTDVLYGEYRTTGRLDVLTHPVHVVRLRKLSGKDVQFDPKPASE